MFGSFAKFPRHNLNPSPTSPIQPGRCTVTIPNSMCLNCDLDALGWMRSEMRPTRNDGQMMHRHPWRVVSDDY
jgi:hypothetical protein